MNLKIIALPLVLVFSCNQYFPRKMLGSSRTAPRLRARLRYHSPVKQIYIAHHGGKRVDLDKRRAAEGIKAFRVAEN